MRFIMSVRRFASIGCVGVLCFVGAWACSWSSASLKVDVAVDQVSERRVMVRLTLVGRASAYELTWPPSVGLGAMTWEAKGAVAQRVDSPFGLRLVKSDSQNEVVLAYSMEYAPPVVDLFAVVPRIVPPPTQWVLATAGNPCRSTTTSAPMGPLMPPEMMGDLEIVREIGVFRLRCSRNMTAPASLVAMLTHLDKEIAAAGCVVPGQILNEVVYDDSLGREVLALSLNNGCMVLVPRYSSSALDLQLVGRRLLTGAGFMPDAPPWIAHGIRELLVDEVVRAELQRQGRADESVDYAAQTNELRWSRLAYIAPVNYAIESGPTSIDGAWVDWSHSVCPLVVDSLVKGRDAKRALDWRSLIQVNPGTQLNKIIWAQDSGVDGPRHVAFSSSKLDYEQLAERLQGDPGATSLLVTAGMRGFLENCGCVVNQAGGAARRNSVAQAARASGAIVVDAGRFSPIPWPDNDIDLHQYMAVLGDAYALGGADCVVPSPHDLAATPEAIEAFVASGNKVVAANVVSASSVPMISSLLVERNGIRIAVLGLSLGGGLERHYRQYRSLTRHYEYQLAASSVEMALRGIDGANVDRYVLVGSIPPAMAWRLSRLMPSDSLIVSIDPVGFSDSELGTQQSPASGKQRTKSLVARPFGTPNGGAVVFVGAESFWCTLITVPRNGPVDTVSSCVLWLDDSVPEHVQTRERVDKFYEDCVTLEDRGVVLPLHERKTESYVGSGACKSCHEPEWAQWKGTRHARAYQTLLAAHRHFVPDCVKCHVVGMNRDGGFSRDNEGVDLQGVGCEVCHGPGSAHVAHPSPGSIMRTPPPSTCVVCHYGEHDPHFSVHKMKLVDHGCSAK